MKINNLFKRTAALVMVISLGLAVSCSEQEVILQEEASQVAEDAISDFYYEDVDDMANLAMVSAPETEGSGGRVSSNVTVNDERFNCATATIEITGQEPISGVITIDFGDGCTIRGVERAGKIIITFVGRRFQEGSTVVTTFENYSVNGVKVEGERTVTNLGVVENTITFNIVLNDGKLTWPDGTSATREHNFNRKWIRAELRANDSMEVTGGASGVNRRGVAYEMEIDENHPITYKRFCPIAVSGIKTFYTANHTIVINYGNGECDRIITITVGDKSREVRVGGRG
jgi:hypothetical protein